MTASSWVMLCWPKENARPRRNRWSLTQCYELDGQGSYVALPPSIFKDATHVTVEGWAKWEEFRSGFGALFEFGGPYQLHLCHLRRHE